MTAANEFFETKPKPVQEPMIRTNTDKFEQEYSAFAQFMGIFGRSYASVDEHMSKFDVFAANHRAVQEHNERFAKGETTWEKSVN